MTSPRHGVSFWLTLFAVVAFAVGTLPTFHGLVCWGVGVVFVVGMRYAAKAGL